LIAAVYRNERAGRPLISVVIPTYKAEACLAPLLEALSRQTVADMEVLVIDSSSPDRTVAIARSQGVRVHTIPKREFDHGLTRMLGAKETVGDPLVYMTQDAIPADEEALARLTVPFLQDAEVGAAYGRQLPRPDASPFGRHLRLFNYPDVSAERCFADRITLGIRAAFCSNSFAAYRRQALEAIGGFKGGLLMGEDMHACARLLKQGYKVQYLADARVVHSHNYSALQDFRRYFDMGVFLSKERWILEEFGRAEGEGIRFLRSELAFLLREGYLFSVPTSLSRAAAKLLGFRLGRLNRRLPRCFIKHLSMHAG
jgi:rhamnosyltransferase